MVRLASLSSSSGGGGGGRRHRAGRDSSSRRGGRTGSASSGRTSSGGNSNSNSRPQLAKAGRSRNLLVQPAASSDNLANNSNSKQQAKKSTQHRGKENATSRQETEVDLHALRRLHRHERTRDIPATLSIVQFPSTPYVDPTNLDHGTAANRNTAANANLDQSANNCAGLDQSLAKTPYGGKMIAGVDGREGVQPTPGPAGRMRRADAGHTPGGIYLPSSAQLTSSTSSNANTATDGNTNAAYAANGRTSSGRASIDTNLPSLQHWDDGVSPLAFGAEARPVRTEREQQAMEAEERRARRERERKRGEMMLESENDGGNRYGDGDVEGSGGIGKSRRDAKGRKGRDRRSRKKEKRSEAYEVNKDGLLVIKSVGSGDGGSSESSKSNANKKGGKSTTGRNKSKGKSKSNSKNKAIAANLRTLGKRGIKSLRWGGAKSRRAASVAAVAMKTRMASTMAKDRYDNDDDDVNTIKRSKSNDASEDATKTPAMPVEMARRIDDGRAVAPYSALHPTAAFGSTSATTANVAINNTSTSRTPLRRHRQPVPLHNFRRLSMIDLRDVASEQQIPTTVKRRVAAAKARAVAAGTAGLAAGAVHGGAVTALACEGARVGGARVVGSARKVGRSATKSMARLRRRIVDNVNAAGYAGERRLFGDDGEEIVDLDVDEIAEDIEEEVITNDFCSYGPDDEDVGSLIGGGGSDGRAIGASRNLEGPKVDLSALNDTLTTLDRSVAAAAGGKNNDFSILWGASEPPTTTKSGSSAESESLNGTRMIPSATNADGKDGGFFGGGEEKVAAAAKASMPREESFTYSYSPFNDTLRVNNNDRMQQSKSDNNLNLTGFLEEPFRSSDEESTDNNGDEEADDNVSPEFTPFVANVNSNGAEAASTNDESMSIATPAIHLCRHFDTALSISGKPKGTAVGRLPSSATLSSGSSLSSGRPPMARLSTGSRSMSSGSRVSSLGSVQSSAASQTISLMTPMDRNTVAGYSATPLRTATKEDIKPLLGDLESPMSGASELLLPSPSPEKNKSAAVSLSSVSGHSRPGAVHSISEEEEDASAFIETVVSELIEEDEKEASIAVEERAGPPSLINSDDDDVASRSTLTQSIVSVSAKQQKADGRSALVVKEEANEGKAEMVVATTGDSFALVPSTYVFTPMDQRQPALTKEAMQNASFLFSPNNMGRVAIQRKIAEKKANRKQRSALERYGAGLRASTEQARIGYARDSVPKTFGASGGARKSYSSDNSLSSIGTLSVSKPSPEEERVSFRVSPESSAATPASHDKGAASAHVESTPQPIVSPSESALSPTSSVPTKSMVDQSAVTPWKTSSPFTRFNNAKKIFGKEKRGGERIESLVSSDEGEAKAVASEATSTSSQGIPPSTGDMANDDAPDDELESFVSAVSHVTPSVATDAEAKYPVEDVKTMVGESAITPFKTNSPAVRFHENKKKLQKATGKHAQSGIPKLTTGMTSATSHAGRLRRNRMVNRKNPRRETGGSGVLAPHRSNLVNPMFASQPLLEDEVTEYSENPSVVPSIQLPTAVGPTAAADEEQSTISSVLSIARECVALSSASAVGSLACSPADGGSDDDDDDEEEEDDDFSLALKSHATTSTFATAKNDRRLSKENKQRSVRWSASTRAADDAKKPSWAGAGAGANSSSRQIILADSFDEESLASSQYTFDKENIGSSMMTPQQPKFAQRKGLVDPRRMPVPGTAALCLSPSARTPAELSKWRELANSANSKNSNTSSAKKLLSSGKKRLSSGKKRLSSSQKKKVHSKHTPMKQLIHTGKHTPLRVYRDNWENKHY